MGFDRLDAKLRAKGSMRGAYPHPMLVTLVYFLTTTVLVRVIQYFVANPFQNFYNYMLQGYGPEEIFAYYASLMTSGRGTVMFFVMLVLSLYSSIMGFGFTSYALRMSRNEQPSYRSLLDGFAMVGRVLLMLILQSVFVFLWSLLGMVPAIVVITIAIVSESMVMLTLAPIVYLAAFVWMVIVSYRYRLAAYFLLDDLECGALDSITRSKIAMQRRKMDLFVLDLSFLGWSILSVFTLGLLELWLSPYRGATQANFYGWAIDGFGDGRNGPTGEAPQKRADLDMPF